VSHRLLQSCCHLRAHVSKAERREMKEFGIKPSEVTHWHTLMSQRSGKSVKQ
jgi:hypothetical protein